MAHGLTNHTQWMNGKLTSSTSVIDFSVSLIGTPSIKSRCNRASVTTGHHFGNLAGDISERLSSINSTVSIVEKTFIPSGVQLRGAEASTHLLADTVQSSSVSIVQDMSTNDGATHNIASAGRFNIEVYILMIILELSQLNLENRK